VKLADWLHRNDVPRSAFARRIGLSPAAISALCNEPNAWISRESAEKIAEATGNQVLPNDFLGLAPLPEKDMSASVNAAIEAFSRGEIVVVTDDEDREGEGDLIVAASLCTPEKMAFIIRNTCGIVCTPVTAAEARRLRLDPMVSVNDAPHGTAFTVTVDYRHGTTTGISAEDRTATVRALANPNAGAADFARPGHIFPLIARDGGVLMRSGHTEAAVDLCRLAGLPPVGVICELVNDDGTVMKGRQVTDFAARHGLIQVTVAEMIAYRQAREKLIERVSAFTTESPIGTLQGYAYRTPFDAIYHCAFVHGSIGEGRDVLTRLHRPNIITDIFHGAPAVHAALRRFKAEGRGVLVYLRDGAAGVPLQPLPESGVSAEDRRGAQWREIGVGAQILRDLGISSIRQLTSSHRAYVGLSGFGIEISGTEAFEP
jgi:3,4-dihydroxy 2-butanone 4-phosphate synthase/GTP cyclohydrolase II